MTSRFTEEIPNEGFKFTGAEKLKNLEKLKEILGSVEEVKEKVVTTVDTFQKAGESLLDLIGEIRDKVKGAEDAKGNGNENPRNEKEVKSG